MDLKKISPTFTVSPQIAPGDMDAIAKAGFRSIICNRPDGEDADQPSFDEIAGAAKAVGIEAIHIPVQGGIIEDEDVSVFGAAIDRLPAPILAYCRTGTRSATLWSFTKADKLPLSEILAVTAAAGYDMSGVAPRIANGGKMPTDASAPM